MTNTLKAKFVNLREFDVEYLFTDNGNIAVIKENNKDIWTIYAHTEKSLKSKVSKWCKENWF